ncbi:hypothetical protein HRbin08_00613 [bacterium HR08]|nr:hypothetical protein HRbin08_00613 [bacterium HR08]
MRIPWVFLWGLLALLLVPPAPSHLALETDGEEGSFGVHILLSGREALLIPASGRIFGVVRVSGRENLSALKVVPEVNGDTVTIRLSPLFTRIEEALTCEQLWQFHSEPTVTISGRVGDTLRVSGFERFALPELDVRIVPLNGASLQDCCECGKLVCCPNSGQCLGCGGYGQCCRRP